MYRQLKGIRDELHLKKNHRFVAEKWDWEV